jgi:hypothetical protein
MNISKAIIAKSDQLNSADLIGGPQTVTIAEVREGNSDQPVQIHLVEWPGRPFKPSKTVLRIFAHAWGEETDDWPQGARMTVFRDPSAKWAGEEVGGIRVSHLSHIDEPFKLALRESQKKTNLHTILPLPADAPAAPTTPPEPTADEVAACASKDELGRMWKRSGPERRAQIEARVAELTATVEDAS